MSDTPNEDSQRPDEQLDDCQMFMELSRSLPYTRRFLTALSTLATNTIREVRDADGAMARLDATVRHLERRLASTILEAQRQKRRGDHLASKLAFTELCLTRSCEARQALAMAIYRGPTAEAELAAGESASTWCDCCVYGNHTSPCTCASTRCCHPAGHLDATALQEENARLKLQLVRAELRLSELGNAVLRRDPEAYRARLEGREDSVMPQEYWDRLAENAAEEYANSQWQERPADPMHWSVENPPLEPNEEAP